MRHDLTMTEPWLRHYATGVPYRRDMPDTQLPALLDDAAPLCTALINEGRRTGLHHLQRAVRQYAVVLRGFGVGYGDLGRA